jgi:hypothetical protein
VVKKVLALVLALAFVAVAIPASADRVNLPVVPFDANLQPIYQSFMSIGGDSLMAKVDNDTLQWVARNLTEISGWFNFYFVAETNAASARFKFKETVYGSDLTYEWGSVTKYPLYGQAGRDAFQICGADSFKVSVVGTDANPDSQIELFYWCERN